ncbi:MAG: hypothetical protein JWN32_155 [Solirubrobacterales bacterium]|nr:hypothetical protein [Solirubrobacterales bacterium]
MAREVEDGVAGSIIGLQRSVGNRAIGRILRRRTLQRAVTEDVLTHSVGEYFAKSLTKAEMSQQVQLLIDALQAPKLDPTDRQSYESNLEVLERFAAAHGTELPAASGFHAQQVIMALAADVKGMIAIAKGMIPGHYSDEARELGPQLNWSVEQLDWLTQTLTETARVTLAAQARGPKSAAQFQEVGVNLTAMIFASKIIAMHQSYLRVAFTVFGHLPADILTKRIANTRAILEPHLKLMKTLSPQHVEIGITGLLDDNLSFDFSQWVDEVEDAMKDWRRFTGIVNIVMLAWTAFDIWMLPTAGGGPPPKIGGGMGGAGGAGVAVGGAVLESVESLEAIRQLIAIGALTSKGLVKVLGGRGITVEGPPKPALSAPKDAKPPGGTPDSARPAAGLPTPEEDLVVERYTRGLADLRERLETMRRLEAKVPRDAKAVDRARAAYASADRELQLIEDEAAQRIDGELVEHLDPLTKERTVLKGGGTSATMTGKRIAAKVVDKAPKQLRGMDFADIEKAIGRAPDVISPASKQPGGVAAGHQRLSWRFEDGSQLIIDDPRALGGRAKSADLPHAELHGPKGERLDQQGILVPEGSISAHMTITDYTGALEAHFAPARAAK